MGYSIYVKGGEQFNKTQCHTGTRYDHYQQGTSCLVRVSPPGTSRTDLADSTLSTGLRTDTLRILRNSTDRFPLQSLVQQGEQLQYSSILGNSSGRFVLQSLGSARGTNAVQSSLAEQWEHTLQRSKRFSCSIRSAYRTNAMNGTCMLYPPCPGGSGKRARLRPEEARWLPRTRCKSRRP